MPKTFAEKFKLWQEQGASLLQDIDGEIATINERIAQDQAHVEMLTKLRASLVGESVDRQLLSHLLKTDSVTMAGELASHVVPLPDPELPAAATPLPGTAKEAVMLAMSGLPPNRSRASIVRAVRKGPNGRQWKKSGILSTIHKMHHEGALVRKGEGRDVTYSLPKVVR